MYSYVNKKLFLIFSLLIVIFCSTIYAGVTGKISGEIINEETGEPIEGVTIRLVGTNFATETDADGEYFIINVPVGKYDVVVSSVGFEQFVKKEVRVLGDLTSPVDFSLTTQTIQIDNKIMVYAENPVIQKDLTGSKVIFTSEQLESLPNIITIQSVLTNYPGVVIGRDNSLHVRGGRSGQVSYYFDGFSVQDPFVNNSGIKIIPGALEELTMTSGGYTAEYGEALSGVVSAVSRQGGSNYKGEVKYYEGFTHTYDVYSGNWGEVQKIDNRSASFWLSGPLPKLNKISDNFSLAGEFISDPGSLPHNEYNSYTGTIKLSFQPIQKMRIVSNLTYFENSGDIYEHRDVNGRSYDFNLDGLPIFEKKSFLFGLSGNYHINNNTIFSTRYSHFYTFTKSAPEHLFDLYWDQWPGYSKDTNGVYNGTIHESNYLGNPDYTDPAQVVGFTTGDDYDPTFRSRKSKYHAFHASLVNQFNKHNQLKTGFEYRHYDIDWDFKQFYNASPYGEKYNSHPNYFSMFLQNKMEYDFYIINMGLRYDYRSDNIKYNANPDPDAGPVVFKEAESSTKISPRLGVSFPISDNSVMHFNYGVYYQVPRFSYMYTNLQGDITSGFPLLGNPNLEPERTISYELGFDYLLNNNLRFDITAYQKDIKDLVTTRSTFKVAGNSVTTFINEDYGSAKGFDIQIEKIPGNGLIRASVSYSYLIAKGNGSSALEPYYTFLTSAVDTLSPVTEFPLDFDQRHTLTAVFDLSVPANYKGRLFGFKMPTNWQLGVVGYLGTGLPYSLTDRNGNRLGDRNEGRMPTSYTVDMRFNKNLQMNKYMLSFFVEVDNLFNKQNIIDVYSLTGRPDYDGIRPTATLALNQDDINSFDKLYDYNPQNYSSPRTIRTGLKFRF